MALPAMKPESIGSYGSSPEHAFTKEPTAAEKFVVAEKIATVVTTPEDVAAVLAGTFEIPPTASPQEATLMKQAFERLREQYAQTPDLMLSAIQSRVKELTAEVAVEVVDAMPAVAESVVVQKPSNVISLADRVAERVKAERLRIQAEQADAQSTADLQAAFDPNVLKELDIELHTVADEDADFERIPSKASLVPPVPEGPKIDDVDLNDEGIVYEEGSSEVVDLVNELTEAEQQRLAEYSQQYVDFLEARSNLIAARKKAEEMVLADPAIMGEEYNAAVQTMNELEYFHTTKPSQLTAEAKQVRADTRKQFNSAKLTVEAAKKGVKARMRTDAGSAFSDPARAELVRTMLRDAEAAHMATQEAIQPFLQDERMNEYVDILASEEGISKEAFLKKQLMSESQSTTGVEESQAA